MLLGWLNNCRGERYTVWGIIGIFIPFVWLICALLPAKEGSPYQRKEAMRWQAQMEQMTR
jgi:hypothetical protein